jgi:hypothetical protein
VGRRTCQEHGNQQQNANPSNNSTDLITNARETSHGEALPLRQRTLRLSLPSGDQTYGTTPQVSRYILDRCTINAVIVPEFPRTVITIESMAGSIIREVVCIFSPCQRQMRA